MSNRGRFVGRPLSCPTLLLWDAHMNAQYITSKGFARYMAKYISKAEPTHLFNVYENNSLREHIIAQRLGSMELMFLLLGHQICNSSITVKFLTTDPPSTRTRSVLPAYMIEEDDENPYYDDTVMKYMHRPHDPQFENLTYPQYYEKYSITPSQPTTSRHTYRDELGNYVVKRKKEIIIRNHLLRIEDGELYFYQQLLRQETKTITKQTPQDPTEKNIYHYFQMHSPTYKTKKPKPTIPEYPT
ncbi:17522_t:CDS:1 [Gigaspora rosea]|nr:17522_t:CDS:1 [Gigaspora rosea]